MGFSPPPSWAQDLSLCHTPLFSLQHPPCPGWDTAAGPWAAVGTDLALPWHCHLPWITHLAGVPVGCWGVPSLMLSIGNSAPNTRTLSLTVRGRGRSWTGHPQAPGGSTTPHMGTASPAQTPMSLHQSQPCHPPCPPVPVTAVPKPHPPVDAGLECDGVSAGAVCPNVLGHFQDVEDSVAAAQAQMISKPSAHGGAQSFLSSQGQFLLLVKHRLMVNEHSWAWISEVFVTQVPVTQSHGLGFSAADPIAPVPER